MLTIRTFGGFGILEDDDLILPNLGPHGREMITYLLFNKNKVIRREKLLDIFYCDKAFDVASNALNSTLFRLKKWISRLDNQSQIQVSSTSNDVIVECSSDNILDTFDFEKVYKKSKAADVNYDYLENHIEAYYGPFLEGIDSSWVLIERERYHSMYIQLLTDMAKHHGISNQFTRAIFYTRKILEIDPLREYIHHLLINLYVLNGQRCEALNQYDQYCEIIKNELGIEPLVELKSTILAIKTGRKFDADFIFT